MRFTYLNLVFIFLLIAPASVILAQSNKSPHSGIYINTDESREGVIGENGFGDPCWGKADLLRRVEVSSQGKASENDTITAALSIEVKEWFRCGADWRERRQGQQSRVDCINELVLRLEPSGRFTTIMVSSHCKEGEFDGAIYFGRDYEVGERYSGKWDFYAAANRAFLELQYDEGTKRIYTKKQ
nr:hypothetical protein [Gammaproteobacteria bacterium]